MFGLRRTFMITAGFYLAAFILMMAVYVERPGHPGTGIVTEERGERVTFRSVLAFENILLLMAVIFGFQFVDRSLGPVVPLHLPFIGVPDTRVTFASGVVFSVLACAAALGHHVCARLLRRWGGRRTLARAALFAAGGAAAMAMVGSSAAFTCAAAAFGLGVGVAMTAAYTSAASAVPGAARATGFGFLTSASLIGMAVSPMVAGLLAHAGIRLVFLADTILLLIFGAVVQRVMEEPTPEMTGPSMEDA
jgi:MFS family permease